MVLFGFDASHYSGDINWSSMYNDGCRFAITKASQGRAYKDATFRGYISGMRAANVLPGAFHFLTRAPADEQIANFKAQVTSAGGPEGMLLALDVEDPRTEPGPRWADVAAFDAEFRKWLPKHELFIYTGAWYWVDTIGNPDPSSIHRPLWDGSGYVLSPPPYREMYKQVTDGTWRRGNYKYWNRATILQFTDRGHMDGKTGDVNAFEGTWDQIKAYAYSESAEPLPTAQQIASAIVQEMWGAPSE